MGRRQFRRVALAFALALGSMPLGALNRITVMAGQMGLGNPGGVGEGSPVLLSVAGFSLPLAESRLFLFELTTLVWGSRYEYVPGEARAVPTQFETADQFAVLGIWVAPLAGLRLPVADGRIEIGIAGTLALNVRIPLLPLGGAAAYLEDAAAYLDGKARFLFPESDLWVAWRVSEDLSLSITAKVLYPLFHVWDGEGAGLGDQLFVAAVVGLSIRLPAARTRDAP